MVDIGCGEGRFSRLLSESRCTGNRSRLDWRPSSKGREASPLGDETYVIGDAEHLTNLDSRELRSGRLLHSPC